MKGTPGRPLKVLLVTGSYPPQLCGVGDYSAGLAKALTSKACSVTVVTSLSGKDAGSQKGVHVRRELPDWSPIRLGQFLRLIDQETPDVVHIQYPSRGYGWCLLPNLTPLVLRILRPRLRLVTTLHEFKGANPLRQASYLFFTLCSHMIVASSQEVRESLESYYPWTRGKVTVIPIGPFLGPSCARVPRVEGSPLLVFPGFLLRSKGPLEALQAVATLRGGYPKIRLVFASEFEENDPFHRELRRWTESLGLEGNVSFTGSIGPPELSALMRKADLVVLPYHDGASTRRSTLVSAVTLGCPVVTTEAQGMLAEFRQGGVLLCRPKDAGALAAAIERYLRDRGIRRTLKSRVGHLASLFDWKRIAGAHRVLYEGVAWRVV